MAIAAISEYTAIGAVAPQASSYIATPTTKVTNETSVSAVQAEAVSSNQAQDGFVKSTSDSGKSNQTYNRNQASKKLTGEQIRELTSQQTAAYSSMINQMLSQQGYNAKNAKGDSLSSVFKAMGTNATGLKSRVEGLQSMLSPSEIQGAKDSVSETGEFGVDAVATRIMDMASALSGGDSSKFAKLRTAVEKGFSAATKSWGVKSMKDMPGITTDTYNEVQKRFDYMESKGTMAGYEYGKTKVDPGNQ